VPANLTSSAPLIVTAELPAPLQGWAEGLRRTHFPPERNVLKAHVTLFHALPASVLDEARALLARIAGTYSPVAASLSAVMDLGGGTAFRIESAGMLALRDEIAEHFHGMLTVQDSHTPRLHVTVQNKVPRAEAMALQAELRQGFRAREFTFAGLALHHYLGGPWGDAGRWSFRGSTRA
jgi:2'-5' RNA ligase superfamily